MEPLRVRWTLEPTDVMRSSKLAQPGSFRLLRVTAIVVALLGVMIIVLSITIAPRGVDIWLSIPFLGMAVYLAYHQLIGYPRMVRKQVAALTGRSVEMWADTDGLHQEAAGTHSWTEWASLTAVDESETTILIWRSRAAAYAIPKRAFGSPDDAEAFLAFVRAHVAIPPAA